MQETSNPTKPAVLPVDFRGIPEHLRQCGRWVIWKYLQLPDGTWQRAWFTTRGNRAGTKDGSDCASFSAVQDAYEYYRRRGRTPDGVAFHLGDCFVALELNNVFINPATEGAAVLPDSLPLSASASQPSPSNPPSLRPSVTRSTLRDWAQALVESYATYTQINTDGLGLTLISSARYIEPSPADPAPSGFAATTPRNTAPSGSAATTPKNTMPPSRPFTGPGISPTAHPAGGTFALYHTGQFLPITGCRWPHSHPFVENRNDPLQALVDRSRAITDIPTILRIPSTSSRTEERAKKLAQDRRRLEALSAKRPPDAVAGNTVPDNTVRSEAASRFDLHGLSPDKIPPFTAGEPEQLTRYREQVEASNRAHAIRLQKEAEQAAQEKARREQSRLEAEAGAEARAKIPETPADKLRRVRRNLKQNYEHSPHIDRVIALALAEFRFGHTRTGETFLVDRFNNAQRAEFFTRGSKLLRDRLAGRTRRVFEAMPPTSVVSSAVQWLHYNATLGEPEEVSLRVATFCPDPDVAAADVVAAVPSRPSPCLPPCATACPELSRRGGRPGPQGQRNTAPPNKEQEQEAHKAPEHTDSKTPNTRHETRDARCNHRLQKLNRKQRRLLARLEKQATAEQTPENVSAQTETRNTKHETLSRDPSNANSDGIVIDLGRQDGQTVLVTASGWRVVDESPTLFHRTKITKKLPIPQPAAGKTQSAAGKAQRGGSLDQLRSFINVDDDAWQMLRGWLIAALFPDIDHPVLLLGGLDGADKGTTLRILSELIDPSTASLRAAPLNIEHWSALAAGGWFLPFENVAAIAPWFAAALGKAVQGRPFTGPKADTEGDLPVLEFRRVIALSGIEPAALPADLAKQVLQVDLAPIEEYRRQPESQLFEEFHRQRPQILGALLDEVSTVLRHLPAVRLDHPPRMADFAKVLAALDLADVGPVPLADVASAVPSRLSSVPLAIASALPNEEQEQERHKASGSVDPKHATLNPEPRTLNSSSNADAPADAQPTPASANSFAKKALSDGADGADARFSEKKRSPQLAGSRQFHSSALAIYLRQIQRMAVEIAEGDPLAEAITSLVESAAVWQGTATELVSAITPKLGRGRPLSPRALSERLRRLAPTLSATGIAVKFDRETDRQRTRQIYITSATAE